MTRKKYNLADRSEVGKARRCAVLTLKTRGFTFKTIAYSLGVTPERASQLYFSALRRRERVAKLAPLPVPSLETVRRFTSSTNSQPAV